jgi:hypothetical protein
MNKYMKLRYWIIPSKISWNFFLSRNPNAIHLLERNPNKIVYGIPRLKTQMQYIY